MVSEEPQQNSEQSPALNIIEEAKKEREALEKLRDEIKIQTRQLAELHASNIMQGRAIASQPVAKEKTDDDIAQEMADETIKKLLGKRG